MIEEEEVAFKKIGVVVKTLGIPFYIVVKDPAGYWSWAKHILEERISASQRKKELIRDAGQRAQLEAYIKRLENMLGCEK